MCGSTRFLIFRIQFSTLQVLVVLFLWVSLGLSAWAQVETKSAKQLKIVRLLDDKELNDALRLIDNELRHHHHSTEHWLYCRKGDAFLQLGNYRTSQKAFTQAIRLEPGCRMSRANRARMSSSLEQDTDALLDLRILRELDAGRPSESLAICYFELGRFDDCIEVCNALIRSHGDRELYLLRAEAEARSGHLDNAREDQISAKRFRMHGTLRNSPFFDCEIAPGFDKQSLKHETFADCISDSEYESHLKAKPLRPGDFKFVFTPPRITHNQYSANGIAPPPAGFKSTNGRPWGWKPLLIPRDSVFGNLRDAVLLFRQERVEDGVLVLQKADSLFPKSHQVFCLLGTAYRLQGQKRKAYKAFSRAHELDPDCQTALQRKIEYSKDFGFSTDVISDLRKLMKLEGNDSCLLHDIALAEYDIGEFEKCVKDCNDALSTEAVNASDLYSLRARANAKLGRLKQADVDASLAKNASHGMRLPPASSYQCDYFRPVETKSNWHNRYDEVFDFTYPSSLGDKLFSVSYARKELGSKDEKPDGVAPRHWEFTLEKSGTRVYVFPTFDYRVENFAETYPPVADAVSDLRTILEKKEKVPKRIPFLPWSDSSTPIISHVKYLKLRNGEAIRYLAAYGIEPDVISNEHLEYVVQGLSKDGRFYISIYVPIKSDVLPDRSDVPMMSDDKYAAFSKGFVKYAKQLESRLNKLRDESFRPDLNELDRMASSVAFHDPFFSEILEDKY